MELYEAKKEAQLLKELVKLLVDAEQPLSEEEAVKQDLAVMTPDNTIMLVAKTEKAKRILRRFIDKESGRAKVPTLVYSKSDVEIKSDYCIERMFSIMKLLKTDNKEGSITIRMNKDFPATIENDNFRVIIAPRIKEE